MIRMGRKGITMLISVMRWIRPSIKPPYQVPIAAMIMVRMEVPMAAIKPKARAIGMPQSIGSTRSRRK